jgi:hypothetical protein
LALAAGGLAVFGLKPVKEAAGLANIEEILSKLVDVEVTISTEIVGLTTISLAAILMVAGSLLFPDKRTSHDV